ncbi:MAG TPA: diguanylate cyclase [Planctomycetota bacterium]|jgi:diguanylate cyclase (GGDEF)-like protein
MPEPAAASAEYDFKSEGRQVEVKLLRGIAMGGKRSVEIQLLLDSQADAKPNYQALALLLTDVSVPEESAHATFEGLKAHQDRMRKALGRPIGIKSAALDYLENIERALNLKDDEWAFTYAQLAQMAFEDHLSGLANYRYFTRRFGEEIKRAERYNDPLSVLMIDIDLFKQFNDRFGHQAGNKALEHLAGILRREVRETDLVARYGGEEFAIILPQTTKHDAQSLGEHLRTKVADAPVDLAEAGKQALTISVGLAAFPRDARSSDSLLAGADAALYESKKNGRNQLSVFLPPSSVTFAYMPDRTDAAQMISVVGDFNGWHKEVDSMAPQADGSFRLQLHLSPGRYAYKFVINNEFYITDPLCPRFAHDGYGGRNSIVIVW